MRRISRDTCDLAVLVNEFPKLSETFVLHDLLALERAGVQLTVISLRRPATEVSHEALRRLKAEVRYLPDLDGRRRKLALRAIRSLLVLRSPREYFRAMAAAYSSPDYSKLRMTQALFLARELEGLGSPPLYIHFAHRPATVGRFAALLLGVPYAISAHAVDIWTTPPKELRAKIRDAQTVLCCYEEARAHMHRLAADRTPVRLVYHGVDLPGALARQEANSLVVLAVGRLIEKKGYLTLVEAAARLRDNGIEFELRIVGEGPLWAALQRQANDLGLADRVRFAGPLVDAELEAEYARAAVFSLPCQTMPDGNRDGIPNTVLEAMARGLPVVSTTLPSVAEAVEDGVQGFLVPPRDPVSLADAIHRLLADAELRARMGAAARVRIAERFDRSRCGPRVFESLADAGLVGRAS